MQIYKMPELLAPGGDLTALQTAVRNGADAVYFGLSKFSARSSAKNLTLEELPEALHFLHSYSARGYLALNTLMRNEELPAAMDLAHQAYDIGVDAIIVQDIGLQQMLRQALPDLILHGSTQMSLGSAKDIETARKIGMQRLVLPRELSGHELVSLTAQAAAQGIQTEAFIHGALCICYSGQCLMSSLIGGRSGNRGACAQPCRLDYQLNGKEGALYSPRDQSLLPFLPAIARTQLTSLKIEGRMRGPAYVGQVVHVYRDALDQLATLAREGKSEAEIAALWPEIITPGLKTLRQAFNRGGDFTQSYWTGKNYQHLMVSGLPGSHGVFLGEISRLDAHRGNLWLNASIMIQPGDVVAIRRPSSKSTEQAVASAPIGSCQLDAQGLLIKGFHPDVLRELVVGDRAYRMNDSAAEQQALKADQRKTEIKLTVTADALTAHVVQGIYQGEKLQIAYLADTTLTPLNPERAAEQLRKTGGTPFRAVDAEVVGDVYLTIGQLNQLRRDILSQLSHQIDQPQRLPKTETLADANSHAPHSQAPHAENTDQLAAFFYQLPADLKTIACGADVYELPLLALNRQRIELIVQIIRQKEPSAQILVHWPAVATGEKSPILRQLIDELPDWPIDGVCTSWPDGDFAEKTAEYTANLMNSQSANFALQNGATTIGPSLELNGQQLSDMIQHINWPERPTTFERPLYGRLRLMTTAYCPIGKNAANCRVCVQSEQPDDARIYPMVDRKQQAFQVIPHPRICQAELLNSDLLAVPEEYITLHQLLPPQVTWRQRLLFCDETHTERIELTQAARQLTTSPNLTQATDTFINLTRRIAHRLNCRLTTGHYQRGVV